MASTAHGTLTANVVTSVSITSGNRGIVVVNRATDGGALWVRLDGQNPAIAGADSFVVLGAREFMLRRNTAHTVKIISDGARPYSVEEMD